MYGRLYCEFVMKKLCSFVGALQVVCLPVSVTVFQPTAEQRQTEDDGVPCQSLVHLWPGLHTRRHTEWIKPVWFAVLGDGRVHSTASCELRHATAEDTAQLTQVSKLCLKRTECQYHVGYSVHGKPVGSANSHFERAVPAERVTRSSDVWRRTTCATHGQCGARRAFPNIVF